MALFNALSKFGNFIGRGGGGLLSRLSSTQPITQQAEDKETKHIINTVNNLALAKASRNFAVVHLLGKQWRVTDGDLIVVEGYWPPTIGDQMSLDKVLLAGTKDFSLIGRPLVQTGLVKVLATVIAKGLAPTKTRFRKKSKRQYMRMNFYRAQQTTLRINSVDIKPELNSPPNVFKYD